VPDDLAAGEAEPVRLGHREPGTRTGWRTQ
jgi:hypothetical protein